MGENRKRSKAELREIPYFRNWQKKACLQKSSLKTSEDNNVIDAKNSRLRLHLLLPDEEADLGGARVGLTDDLGGYTGMGKKGGRCAPPTTPWPFVAKAEFGG